MLALGERQYREADNMTDGLAALSAVVNADRERGDALLQDFLAKWQTDPLVMDKWLSLQAACPLPLSPPPCKCSGRHKHPQHHSIRECERCKHLVS